MEKNKRQFLFITKVFAFLVLTSMLMLTLNASNVNAQSARDYTTTINSLVDSQDYNIEHGVANGQTVTGTQLDKDYEGIMLTGKSGNVQNDKHVNINNAIYIGDNTKDDLLAEILILPTQSTKRDFDFIYITLTDVSDSSNSITIGIAIRPGDNALHNQNLVIAKANNGNFAGWQGSVLYQFYMGTLLNNSFGGQVHTGTDYSSIKLFYDNTERAIYVQPARGGNNKVLVRDLDDDLNLPVLGAIPAVTDEAFEGFESNQCYISISTEYKNPLIALDSFRNENKDAGKFILVNLDGQTFIKTEQNTIELTGNTTNCIVSDINIDGKINEQIILPQAVYAYNFLDGKIDLTSNYYVKATLNNKPIALTGLNNGKWTSDAYFVPTVSGQYAINYYNDPEMVDFVNSAKVVIRNKVTTDSLFEYDSAMADLTVNAALPSYIQELNRGGEKSTDVKGINIKTKGTDEINVKYNKIIDLSKLSADDKLFEFIVTPEVKTSWSPLMRNGEEFNRLYIRLTDIHDPNNYVEVLYYRRGDNNTSMSGLVATKDQDFAGWNNINQTLQKLHYGTPINASFAGQGIAENSSSYNSVVLKMDYDNRQMTTFPSRATDYTIIRDLDNSDHLNVGEKRWEGFTTGEVELSFRIAELNTRSSVTVLNIFGQDLEGESILDVTPPQLTFEESFVPSALPTGEKGKAYPIYNVSAYDLFDGNINNSNVDIKAYYAYETENQQQINIADNVIIPQEKGLYTLIYTAYDSYYNSTVKMYEFEVLDKLNPINIELNFSVPNTVYIGDNLLLPQASVIGGSLIKSSEITITDPSNNTVNLEKNYIMITQQGYYIVTYKVTDYLGFEFILNNIVKSIYGTKPSLKLPTLPPAIIAGSNNTFFDFEALDYHSYPGLVMTARKEIAVSENGEDYKVLTNRQYLSEANQGYVDVRFRAYSLLDNNYTEQTVRLEIINPTGKGELFYSEDEINIIYDNHKVTYSTAQDGAKMSFLNALPSNGFTMEFKIPESAGFNTLKFVLKDSGDRNQLATITITKGPKNIIKFGTASIEINNLFGSGRIHNLLLKNNILYIDSTPIANLTNWDSGEVFNGFSSALAYFDIVFEDIYEGQKAEFYLNSLMNQASFSKDMTDRGQPGIITFNEIAKVAYLGDNILVPITYAFDVISGSASILMTVLDPDGNTVIDEVIPDKDIYFRATKYGNYNIRYTATDLFNNKTTVIYNVYIKDMIAPQIQINGAPIDKAVVGTEITLPAAVAYDNRSSDVKTFEYAIDAYGTIHTIENYKFTPSIVGRYTIIYFAQDEDGNFTIKKFQIMVSEGN